MKRHQLGYFSLDFRPLLFFAVVGLLALVFGAGWLVVWLIQHVRIA